MYSSKTDEWATPQALFNELDKEFHFTLDPCATKENTKCARFYTKEDNGLNAAWGKEVVFMNPPYGRKIKDWVERAQFAHKAERATVVCLLPARTDTQWFHDYIYNKAEIRFLRGRLKFNDGKNPAPFPSMVVIYR